MIGRDISMRFMRAAFAVSAAVAGFGMMGATTYQWAEIPKGDRVAATADCRDFDPEQAIGYRGADDRVSRTERIDVAPGLSIVQRTDG